MENNRLKNSLIAAGIAVFAGVLVFGVNAAVGDAPGYNPPGAGVIPTFTALNVDDNIFVGNSVSATADLIAGGNIFALGSLSVGLDLDVSGNVQIAGSTAIYGDFIATGDENRFDGDLEVDGVLEVSGGALEVSNFYGISTGDANPVKINDDLDITGNITGDVQIQNDLHVGRNLAVDSDIDVLGGMDIAHNIIASGRIEGNFLDVGGADVGGDLDVTGDVQLGAGSMVGSVYKVTSHTSGTWIYTDSCYSDDILLSCGGYSPAKLKGLIPAETSCTVWSASSTDIIYAYLTCLDPEGIRTGLNP